VSEQPPGTWQPPVPTSAPASTGPGAPPYGQPQDAQPPYGQSAYGQPAYGQPAYGQPAYGQPRWGQPAYGQPPPDRPGVVPLRPLGLGEILDGAVQTMRHNPRVMFGLSAVVAVITTVVTTVGQLIGLGKFTAALESSATGPASATEVAGATSGLLSSFVGPAMVQSLALSVLTGILIVAVSEAVIGRRPDVGEVSRRVGWAGVGRLVLLTLLIGLAFTLLTAALVLPVVGLYFWTVPAGVIGTVVLVPVLIGCLFFGSVKVSFAAPALLLERIGIRAALARSWRLVAGSWWRVLGILLLGGLIASFASGLLQAPFSVVGIVVAAVLGNDGGATGSLGRATVISTVITNLGTIVGTTVVAPFSAAVTSLLYIDLRMRREGLDVALARAAQDARAAADGSPST
jgi:hypothetical protein